MMDIEIPGFRTLRLSHLVLDFNGTLAHDGRLIHGVTERILALGRRLEVHILTADTFGRVQEAVAGAKCTHSIIPHSREAEAKLQYIQNLGFETTACIGNGRNDRLMLKEAALGVAVIQGEGASLEAILAADVVTSNILDALDLLLNPLRLKATLRS